MKAAVFSHVVVPEKVSSPSPSPSSSSSSSKQPHKKSKMKTTSSSSTPPTSSSSTTTTTTTTTTNKMLTILRSLLLDIPLVVIFSGYMTLYAIATIHDTYYMPLMDRSTRTDTDLYEEFTYYHRHCTERDLTTRTMSDLAADPTAPVEQTVHQLLKHGAVVIPQILSPETVRDLRAYAVHRNKVLKDEEEYPMSQGEGGTRRSFGYDATEHPALVQALREVTHHKHLRQTLQAVLGDQDPASTEITTITAYYGAIPQEWHSDTKEDGNALKYARTYSHSYSLFLPLQNTTGPMGATDICPGTHYCANSLDVMCEETKMGIHQANPETGVFTAGDGALLNQHVWHRGGPHTDPDALERIVFIVSFLARPDFSRDTRQLSRGTYFHQKWIMWGHTWRDLQNPMRSMQYPFSLLRCLSLWKPPAPYSWGYDLITSGFMRFSNEQMDLSDISDRLVPRFDDFHYPTWLRGPVLWHNNDYKDRRKQPPTQKRALKAFIGGTIHKTYHFLRQVTWTSHAAYGALLLLVTLFWSLRQGTQKGRAVLRRAVFRLTLSHGLVASLIFLALARIKSSDWGQNVISGKALMRPFPPVRIASSDEMQLVSTGPTTYPETFDVLMGTRFDVKWLGSYEQWLDYHPGNQVYLQQVAEKAWLVGLYQHGRRRRSSGSSVSTTHLPIAFAQRLLQETIEAVTVDKRGRFLQQDYRTGDWLVMSKDEIEAAVALEMAWKRTPMHAALEQVMNRFTAYYRFGVVRNSALARKSPVYLHHLKHTLVGMNPTPPTATPTMTAGVSGRSKPVTTAPSSIAIESAEPRFSRTRLTIARNTSSDEKHVASHIRFELPSLDQVHKDTNGFRVGDTVVAQLADGNGELWWNRGHILSFKTTKKGTKTCTVAMGSYLNTIPNIPLSKVRLWEPVVEGDRVQGCFSDFYEECFPGTVTRVMPDESVRVAFDDGDVGERMPTSEYYKPPYKPYPAELDY